MTNKKSIKYIKKRVKAICRAIMNKPATQIEIGVNIQPCEKCEYYAIHKRAVKMKEAIEVKPCKYCGCMPLIADVGGNNPWYEIGCNCCEETTAVHGEDLKKVTCYWNELNR